MNVHSYFQTKTLPSLGLLAFRLVMGAAFILHGMGKVPHAFNWMGDAVPGPLQAIAAYSEFGGGIGLVLGLLTPLSALGIIGTMLGALFLAHLPANHPFVSMDGGHSYELPLGYLAGAILFLFNSPGKFSMDYFLVKQLSKPAIHSTPSSSIQ
jgi:putative oxidoreductase